MVVPRSIASSNEGKKKGTKRNFVMICLAYVCSYTSLNAVISLQSSINTDANVGLYSLAILYGSSLITSLFFTTPIGYIFGYKWSIVGGQLGAMVYVASNMYPQQWLMFSTAVICGVFRACMFMAQEAYVSVLAGGEDENDNDEKKNRKYFSIFFSAYQSAEIWGNLISYLVLRKNPATVETDLEQCGANFLEEEQEAQLESGQISPITTYILFSIFAGVIMVSVLLVIILLSQKRETKKDDSKGIWHQSVEFSFTTLKTLFKPMHLIIFPLGYWTESAQMFFMRSFTNSFITCSIGIQYVGVYIIRLKQEKQSLIDSVLAFSGLIMTMYGVTVTLSSIVIVFLVKRKYSRPICFILAALLSYSVFIVMLIWKPTSPQTYVLFILPCLSSISTGITEPFITAMYNSVFPGKKDTAFSLLTFAQTASCLILLLIQTSPIVYVSSANNRNGSWCLGMLSLSSSGRLTTISSTGSGAISINGSVLMPTMWTYTIITYSIGNGLRLHTNATRCNCTTGQFFGVLDEFRLYSRELTTPDILSLFNNQIFILKIACLSDPCPTFLSFTP
ncbi:unnamed protein product [Adineta ricciae]|uniref:Uncharacterized protein n=1 Tax=Adineta ricciae TaxID=249248 RepID=A0A815GU68_ADIRI|nr:unnamed protein product [Adineta ricciae]